MCLCLCEVSLENVLLDVKELGKGMDLIRRECSLHDHSVLKGFIQGSDGQLDKLQKDAKAAEVTDTVHFHPNLKVSTGKSENRHKANTYEPLLSDTHAHTLTHIHIHCFFVFFSILNTNNILPST